MIIDPHGEYNTLQEAQNIAVFADGNYKPKVRIFRPDMIRVRIDSLTLADLRYLLPNLSEKMHYQLTRAYQLRPAQQRRPIHAGAAPIRRASGG